MTAAVTRKRIERYDEQRVTTMSEIRPWDSQWKVVDDNFGGGGQGITMLVSRVTDPQSRGVLKRLRYPKRAKDRSRMHRERSALETLAQQGLKVPHVLGGNTHEHEDLSAELYFVMERIEGLTVAKEIEKRGSFSLEKAVEMTLDLCATVAGAHEEGILHRDLKPANIIVRDYDKSDMVIVDYGLSFNKAENESEGVTDTNETIGNKFYRSLEWTLPGADKHDQRSDVASLTAIFYYCLTGHNPVQSLDGHGKMPHQRAESELKARLKDHARLKDILAVLDRGFAPDFDSRFHTAGQLAERLNAILQPTGMRANLSLEAKSRDVANKVRKADRSARLLEVAAKLKPVGPQLLNIAAQAAQRLDPLFSFSPGGTVQAPKLPGIDNLAIPIMSFQILVHGILPRMVSFAFGADGEQVVLMRNVVRLNPQGQPLNPQGQVLGKAHAASIPWDKISWFAPESPPGQVELRRVAEDSIDIVMNDFEDAISGP